MIFGQWLKAPIHYQTQSYDTIGCYGNSVERTIEIAYRIWIPAYSPATESDSGSGPLLDPHLTLHHPTAPFHLLNHWQAKLIFQYWWQLLSSESSLTWLPLQVSHRVRATSDPGNDSIAETYKYRTTVPPSQAVVLHWCIPHFCWAEITHQARSRCFVWQHMTCATGYVLSVTDTQRMFSTFFVTVTAAVNQSQLP